jgi:hypothetical protein
MGWEIGFDSNWNRDIGYGVPATCDEPGCDALINRGLSYVCGGEPYGGESGCGLHFCAAHLLYEFTVEDDVSSAPQRCSRCCRGEPPCEPTPDVRLWNEHKLTHESWAQWRSENVDEVERLRVLVSQERRFR